MPVILPAGEQHRPGYLVISLKATIPADAQPRATSIVVFQHQHTRTGI